ncbi:hypothetical protein RFN57_03705 [Streptomyces violaceochromogenes]|uniref:Uncharacterized protein n=1 Tax=Streptomyces violaceochromogenes TaxID=67377 RepID=A0ABU6LPH5_9ACTN|nr:hypothetical protein [Streptomyces violaceochromogenes]MEC7051407.1 hypothetical protein [Streptomyces violaceochromogenes]GHC94032.1 hypothetical protein GCM10010309_78950 [Streptomyces violaceochromogenes]
MELNADEETALAHIESPTDTSETESAVLAGAPDTDETASHASAADAPEETASPAAPADESADAAAAANAKPWKEPKWCIDAGVDSTWYIERMRGCGIWRAEVNVRETLAPALGEHGRKGPDGRVSVSSSGQSCGRP